MTPDKHAMVTTKLCDLIEDLNYACRACIAAAIKAAVEEEREACAKAVEALSVTAAAPNGGVNYVVQVGAWIAATIRARGEGR